MDQDYDGTINIVIRDDGSSPEIIDYLKQLPSTDNRKIQIIDDKDGNLGYAKNFERLMERSTAPYAFFADQDDVWHPNKISRSVTELQEQETQHGQDTPIMVHHDYALTSQDGSVKIKSANTSKNGAYEQVNFAKMMHITHASGFSIGMNQVLLKKALPFPDHTFNHDAHVSILAAATGQIIFIPESLANYRIHESNTSGPQMPFFQSSHTANRIVKTIQLMTSMDTFKKLENLRENLSKKRKYLGAFLEQYKDDPSFKLERRKTIEDFLKLDALNPFQKVSEMKKLGFFPGQTKIMLVAAFTNTSAHEEEEPPSGLDIA